MASRFLMPILALLTLGASTTRAIPAATPVSLTMPLPTVNSARIMSDQPTMPSAPSTDPNCSWWWDNDGSVSCERMPYEWSISFDDFLAWNPSVKSDCSNFKTGYSYCVEAPPPLNLPPPTTTSTKPSSPTESGNGIQTPQPTQPGLINNCNEFYFVESGEGCATVAKDHGISLSQFLDWNPKAGNDCNGLWANAYACVGIKGGSSKPSSTTKTRTSTTSAGNGIKTPSPIQPGMGENCDRFHLVKSGENCAIIGARYSMTAKRIQSWNGLNSDCSNLWADAYVCVRAKGYSIPINLSCYSSPEGKAWLKNRDAARKRAVDWCDGSSKTTDGNGAYSLAQTKTGCYNAPDGDYHIQFTMRNDFGAPASITTGRCEKLIGEHIDGCTRGGTGVSEGWWFRTILLKGKC